MFNSLIDWENARPEKQNVRELIAQKWIETHGNKFARHFLVLPSASCTDIKFFLDKGVISKETIISASEKIPELFDQMKINLLKLGFDEHNLRLNLGCVSEKIISEPIDLVHLDFTGTLNTGIITFIDNQIKNNLDYPNKPIFCLTFFKSTRGGDDLDNILDVIFSYFSDDVVFDTRRLIGYKQFVDFLESRPDWQIQIRFIEPQKNYISNKYIGQIYYILSCIFDGRRPNTSSLEYNDTSNMVFFMVHDFSVDYLTPAFPTWANIASKLTPKDISDYPGSENPLILIEELLEKSLDHGRKATILQREALQIIRKIKPPLLS